MEAFLRKGGKKEQTWINKDLCVYFLQRIPFSEQVHWEMVQTARERTTHYHQAHSLLGTRWTCDVGVMSSWTLHSEGRIGVQPPFFEKNTFGLGKHIYLLWKHVIFHHPLTVSCSKVRTLNLLNIMQPPYAGPRSEHKHGLRIMARGCLLVLAGDPWPGWGGYHVPFCGWQL